MKKATWVDSLSDTERKRRDDFHNKNPYEGYRQIAKARGFYNEYANMARLVDDLDIRFWKRFALRDFQREDSIDKDLQEDKLRTEYKNCVSDLIILRNEVAEALCSVRTGICHDILKERYVHGLSQEAIAEKWDLDETEVFEIIQQGLWETKVPEEYRMDGDMKTCVYQFKKKQ